MTERLQTSMGEMILCLCRAMDLVSPVVADHHRRVAYIACRLAEELALPPPRLRDLVLAAALHDIGGLTLRERVETINFEIEDPFLHAERGYLLLRSFSPFAARIAPLVRFHHLPWQRGAGTRWGDEPVPGDCHLLHLADRIAVLISPQQAVLSQVDAICRRIRHSRGEMFVPEAVEAFLEIAQRECFWLDAVSPLIDQYLGRTVPWDEQTITAEELFGVTRLFCRIIDFRSRFTAAHTGGVAACAERLARLSGFTEAECEEMRIAGYLHDLGKLAVPAEILNKTSGLSRPELDIIRTHTYFTNQILQPVRAFDRIRPWGAQHHERLAGNGYPYHLKGAALSTGSRIMAVADVFVALSEERPYRPGMAPRWALKFLRKMVASGGLDGEVVDLLERHFEDLEQTRISAQSAERKEYRRFTRQSYQLSQDRSGL